MPVLSSSGNRLCKSILKDKSNIAGDLYKDIPPLEFNNGSKQKVDLKKILAYSLESPVAFIMLVFNKHVSKYTGKRGSGSNYIDLEVTDYLGSFLWF